MDAVIKIEVDFNGKTEKTFVVRNASGSIPPSKHDPEYLVDVIASKLSSVGAVSVQKEAKPVEKKVSPPKKTVKKA